MKSVYLFSIAVPIILFSLLCLAQDKLPLEEISIGVLAEQGVDNADTKSTPIVDDSSNPVSGLYLFVEPIILEHGPWVIVVMILLIFLLVYVLRTRRKLTASERNLSHEIVERKETEATLADYKKSLEKRVVERTNDIDMVNQSLQKSQSALRNLVEITSSPRLSHEDKLTRLLETGREYYQTAAASISSLEEYHKRLCVVADKKELFRDYVGPLNKICVQQAIAQFNKPLDIPNLNIKNYKYPGCGSEVLNSYLATAVLVKGRPHYVLEFADIIERKGQYTHWDHNMLQLMARWIGSEIEKQEVIEEQQRNQTELARVSRMSAMGEMVAGLAHELNQPLTGAINYSSACLRRLKYEKIDREKLIIGLERAVEGATLAADIIRQLREFVKKGKSAKEPVNINVVVLKIVDLLSAEIRRHRTRVTLQLADNIPVILANEIQLEQVVLNFIRNSLDAMENTEARLREIIITTELDYDKVRLFVMDFGDGIPATTEGEVFDAFYTTKSDGMGMGLSISRTIIEEHNGTIVANNNPETGACFSFEIPANSSVVQ
ncbi:MAG: sensor histidine kinase [Thiohalomonadales bacterium]